MSTNTLSSNKLKGKDLINVGIYTALYFIICMVVAFTGYIPIFMALLNVLVPIAGGIPFMLFLTKVNKPGMITLMGLIMGILMLITGMGYYAIFTGIVAGLITEFVLKCGNYESKKLSIIANGTFSMWIIGNFIPLYVNRNNYLLSLTNSGNYANGYADQLAYYVPEWSFLLFLIMSLVSGIIGGWIGMKLLKKHFSKAGIA